MLRKKSKFLAPPLLLLFTLAVFAVRGKEESRGESISSAPVPSSSFGSPPVGVADEIRNGLVLLPESPRANTPLIAVYQGGSGQLLFRWEKNGDTIEGQNSDRLPAGFFIKGDTITAIVKTGTDEFRASITIGNLPPQIHQVKFQNPKIHRNVDIALLVTGEDPDGDEIAYSYTWFRNGDQLSSDSAMLPGDRFSRGDRIRFVVTPRDSESEGLPYEGEEIVIPNAPPVFVTAPPLNFQAKLYRYRANADDPDGDTLTYSLDQGPAGMTIDQVSGVVSWELAAAPLGEHFVSIVADDAGGQRTFQDYKLVLR